MATVGKTQLVDIYLLIDPRTHAIRYVGKTASGRTSKRLSEHLKKQDGTHKANWIAQLTAEGLIPSMVVIARVPIDQSNDAESYWISYYRLIGCDLTNLTVGGDGVIGYAWTEAQKARASTAQRQRFAAMTATERMKSVEAAARSRKGTKHALESRKKMSDAVRAIQSTPEARERLRIQSAGRVHSPETRSKMSASLKGRTKSPEHRANLSTALKQAWARKREAGA